MRILSAIRNDLKFTKDLAAMTDMLMSISAQQFYNLERSKKERFEQFLKSFDGFLMLFQTMKNLIH